VELIRDILVPAHGAQEIHPYGQTVESNQAGAPGCSDRQLPALDEITALFPTNIVQPGWAICKLRPESKAIRFVFGWIISAIPNSAQVYAASDYLEWGDGFKTNFDLIREALKRPYARIDGITRNPSRYQFLILSRPVFGANARIAHPCYLLLGQRKSFARSDIAQRLPPFSGTHADWPADDVGDAMINLPSPDFMRTQSLTAFRNTHGRSRNSPHYRNNSKKSICHQPWPTHLMETCWFNSYFRNTSSV